MQRTTCGNMDRGINIRLIIIISSVLLALVIGPLPGFPLPRGHVDQTIVKHLDVTGDGIADDLVLHIKGESWNKPLKWSLTIISKGKNIFEHKSDDTWLDNFFNDRGYVNKPCSTYLECKKQYYLHDLLDDLVVKTDLSQNMYAFDKSNKESIHFVAKKELMTTFKLSESEAIKTIDWMIIKLKTGNRPVLYVPISPVQNEFPRMYVDRVGSFVTIYNW
jgi:hypothetical protein